LSFVPNFLSLIVSDVNSAFVILPKIISCFVIFLFHLNNPYKSVFMFSPIFLAGWKISSKTPSPVKYLYFFNILLPFGVNFLAFASTSFLFPNEISLAVVSPIIDAI